ncbi:hypothetical protein [Cupriavidus sp. UYPR2.512]|uniref:hypothetical protein n=1 Tax=Cupriavidus sp. UYPR2.512 TaxID=1080187 RepID=UPI00039D699D|nr:hypothetical protein [Cupriavidus sp. UYPR2.512]UIF87918.1 hypothetical protein KAF44_21560 [Cupriavidus necator]
MTQIFNTHIAGNVANGGNGVSQQMTVNVGAGDWEALRHYLHSLGLQDSDLVGLRADLDGARSQEAGMVGKPSTWFGKLCSKAVNGAAEVAAAGIAKAIAGYLGLS